MISVYSDCVYDIGRFIVYLSIILFVFLCWEWVRYIGCVPSICILGFILFWEVIDYILGLCTQKYLEFSGL